MTQTNQFNKFLPKGKLKNLKGSIINTENAGLRLVLSVCNMAGKLDEKLFTTFDKKWPAVRRECKGWYSNQFIYKLGTLNTTAVQSDVWVVHLLCQDKEQKTNETALNSCLKNLASMAKEEKATVHISRLVFEKVPELGSLVESMLINQGISVYTYDEQ